MSFVDLGTPPPLNVYPAWSILLIENIDKALSMAWERIQTKFPNIIATADEDKITDQLLTELTLMRKKNEPLGFNSDIFSIPVRDGKLPNMSGSSIDQMPDITIYLAHPRHDVADDRHDALFYECKVIKGKRNLGLYRKNGIQRFVDGQYAWHMPHAGMIGYIFDPITKCPVNALTKYFSRKTKKTSVGEALGCTTSPVRVMAAPNKNTSDIAMTIHARKPGKTISSKDKIELRHLWLF